ncbi:MAG: arsenic efflux protein [Deltaproteobacteria bacterium]|nr:arsenic efflux protein [Deltaproteobacteria bacterium]
MDIIIPTLNKSLMITMFVFVMMTMADYLNVLTEGKLNRAIQGGRVRQYIATASLGAIPGCLGAFMNVSFYVHGLITFGAIVGGMLATSGDEAFVMLALFPGKAVLLFAILFVVGICSAWLVDKLVPLLKIRPCEGCETPVLHEDHKGWHITVHRVKANFQTFSLARFLLLILLGIFIIGSVSGAMGPAEGGWERITFILLLSLAALIVITAPEHYLHEHIWVHIAKGHLWRILLWSFGALLVIEIGLRFWNLEAFVQTHMPWVLLVAVLVGVVPESGPHLIFVMMFAQGLIPFSVLLASSIVQDGHGMLPLLAYSFKDSLLIKAFNVLIGLGIGLALYLLGL